MANLKTSIKDVRQKEARRKRNRAWKVRLKENIKNIDNILNGKNGNLKDALSKAYKTIDKMAKIGIIKKQTASRKKSRLSRKINKAESNK